MITINISSSNHSQIIDITHKVTKLIPKNFNGICHLFMQHTTCAITINENADEDVKHDILKMFDVIAPWNKDFFKHYEGNSAAHVKSSLLGFSQTIPIENGLLKLGTWQGIFFCEFDGPRTERQILVQFFTEQKI
ncbi:secondary thiamine-phosphate synthase enzyme YjbQ [Lentisphaerota bacterium WC36G]|nr:secondary thiamine-phosphate synthase enzyme YjbQ [Lentisphaerae bacterium WC36]